MEASQRYPCCFLEEDHDLVEVAAGTPGWGATLYHLLNPDSEKPKYRRIGTIVNPGDVDDVKVEEPCLVVGRRECSEGTVSYASDAALNPHEIGGGR